MARIRIEPVPYGFGPVGKAVHLGLALRELDPDVDLELSREDVGGVNLAWWNAGEWLQWNTPEMAAGTWRIRVRLGTPWPGGMCTVSIDGADVALINVPNTGGWHEYQDVVADVVVRQAGTHTVRIMGAKAAANGTVANFDQIHFTWLNDTVAEAPMNRAAVPHVMRPSKSSYDARACAQSGHWCAP